MSWLVSVSTSIFEPATSTIVLNWYLSLLRLNALIPKYLNLQLRRVALIPTPSTLLQSQRP